MSVKAGKHTLETGIWSLDPAHSEVGFFVRHAGISKVRGKFSDVAATINVRDIEDDNFEITAVAKADSFDSGDVNRDAHVKGADFLDVENFPEVLFDSTKVTFDDDEFTLKGNLTIRGVTKTVKFKGSFYGIARDPFGVLRAGMEATATINRKDFGIVWNAALDNGGVLVSDKVKLVLELSFAFDE
ncbi:MAG: YceI family protein [Enterococcus sp.]|nr:YceI family protein [Enterococcus sp.]